MTFFMLLNVTTGDAVDDFDDELDARAAVYAMRQSGDDALNGLHLVEYDDDTGRPIGEGIPAHSVELPVRAEGEPLMVAFFGQTVGLYVRVPRSFLPQTGSFGLLQSMSSATSIAPVPMVRAPLHA